MPNAENPVFAKTAVLQILRQGPGYGSQLVERIHETTKGVLSLSAGAIYPVLRSLEAEELVTKVATEGRIDTYAATAKGRTVARRHRRIVAGLFGF